MKKKQEILDRILFYKNGIEGLEKEDGEKRSWENPQWGPTIRLSKRLIEELKWVLEIE